MTVIVKKGTNKAKLDSQLQKALKDKGFPADKFCGTVHFDTDPLTIQKKMRDEWQ